MLESLEIVDILLVLVVTTCGVTDVMTHRIYNAVTYPSIILAIGINLSGMAGAGMAGTGMSGWGVFTGVVAGFVPLFLLFLMGGIGGGDVKLMTCIGAFKGTFFVLSVLMYALLIGSVFGILKVAWSGELKGILQRVFYTFLHTATPGMGPTSHIDPEGPRINFGAAIAVATWVTLISEEWLLGLL